MRGWMSSSSEGRARSSRVHPRSSTDRAYSSGISSRSSGSPPNSGDKWTHSGHVGLLSIKWTKKDLILSHLFILPRSSVRVAWRPLRKGTNQPPIRSFTQRDFGLYRSLVAGPFYRPFLFPTGSNSLGKNAYADRR